MKINYLISLTAAAMVLSTMSAAADNDITSLKNNFFPAGNITPQMEEAMAALPLLPSTPALPGMDTHAEKAAAFEPGMNGPWRPSQVISYTDKGANLFKYIYYYDKDGRMYAGCPMIRIYQNWNATDECWDNKSRYRQIFDERGDMVGHYSDLGYKNQWNNWYYSVYTYDDNHNTLTALQQTWYEDQWFGTLKWDNTYDANGNILTQTYYNRPMGSSEWVKGSQITWEYDEAGRITLYQMARWNEEAGEYVPNMSNEYTFDANGNLLTEKQTHDGKNVYLYTFTYDENNNKVTFLHQKWNESEWVNYLFVDFTYDAQNRETESITKMWADGDWKLNNKKVSQYLPTVEAQTNYSYDAEKDKWQEKSRIIRRYDADGHLICVASDRWSDQFGFLKTESQDLYTYENGLLVSQKSQTWNATDMKFDDNSDFAFTYNDDRNCTNVTATKKQSKETIFAPYNDMADEWPCPDYDPYIGDLTYMNVNDYVEPTGITLDVTECELETELSKQLVATVQPSNVSNPECYWKSSDDKIARVSVNGRVYGIADGEATITAITMDGRFTAECKVKVGTSGIYEASLRSSFAYTDGQIRFTPATERHAISVYDISGNAVCDGDARTIIPTDSWASGLYIVKVTEGNTTKAYKIIVK